MRGLRYRLLSLTREKKQMPGCTLATVHATFRRLGVDYDLDAINVVLATAVAEKLKGDPLWLLIVLPLM